MQVWVLDTPRRLNSLLDVNGTLLNVHQIISTNQIKYWQCTEVECLPATANILQVGPQRQAQTANGYSKMGNLIIHGGGARSYSTITGCSWVSHSYSTTVFGNSHSNGWNRTAEMFQCKVFILSIRFSLWGHAGIVARPPSKIKDSQGN